MVEKQIHTQKKLIMKTKLIISFCLLFFISYKYSYAQIDTIAQFKHTSHLKLVQIEQGNSYITSPWDIGNIEDLTFEGNLIPNFIVRENDKAHLMMVLTAQVIIRMYNEYSLPVKTPSYMPHLSLYYSIGNPVKHAINSVFLRFGHHSNGQRDSTYLENGEINLESGNFSTNYLEIGGVRAFKYKPLKSILFFESTFEYHLRDHTEESILGKYSLYRLNTRFSILSVPKYFKNKGSFQFDAQAKWLFGDVNHWKNFDKNRIILELTAYYSPKFLEEIGFFVKYYYGMDYYNIYFNHHLNILRFGIMTEILRF